MSPKKTDQTPQLLFTNGYVDAFWLALQFHATVMAAVPISPRGNRRRSQVERESVSSVRALGKVGRGDEQHAIGCLIDATRAVSDAVALVMALSVEGRIAIDAYNEVVRTADRVQSRLRELVGIPVTEWPVSELPPAEVIDSPPSEPTDVARKAEITRPLAAIKAISARAQRLVAEAGRAVSSGKRPPGKRAGAKQRTSAALHARSQTDEPKSAPRAAGVAP